MVSADDLAALEAHKRACGADSTGGYDGVARGDPEAVGAQNASDVKRRVLAGMGAKRATAWRQTCACPNATPVPAVVLDPFSGSGTTGVVAVKHGRAYIGIDASAEYCAVSTARIAREALLQASAKPRDEARPTGQAATADATP